MRALGWFKPFGCNTAKMTRNESEQQCSIVVGGGIECSRGRSGTIDRLCIQGCVTAHVLGPERW